MDASMKKNDMGTQLKQKRLALGMTLKWVADGIGLRNFQTLSKIENGKRQLRVDELARLARFYMFDVNFFLEDKELPKYKFHWYVRKKRR